VSAVPSFLALFLIFAVPVGYVFGTIPALVAGAIYSGALTAMPTVSPRPLLRAGLGAACGALPGEVWFHAFVGPGSSSYALAAALVMGLFALRWTGGPLAAERSPSVACQAEVLT
jgi:hypothetical protein